MGSADSTLKYFKGQAEESLKGEIDLANVDIYEDVPPRWMGIDKINGPSSTVRVPLFAARALNATGQSRVTLSLR